MYHKNIFKTISKKSTKTTNITRITNKKKQTNK